MLKRMSLAALVFGLMSLTPPITQAAQEYRGHCRRIHEAARALEVARRELEEARHDFCGRREEALRDTDTALRHLRAAEECDRCR